jgi:hypothetical protein
MIQVFAVHNEDNLNGNAVVVVDGIKLETRHASWMLDEKEVQFFNISLTETRDVAVIFNFSIEDFPPLFLLNLDVMVDWLTEVGTTRVGFQGQPNSTSNKNKPFRIYLNFITDLKKWKKEYSFFAYYAKFEELFKNNQRFSFEWVENNPSSKGFRITQLEPVNSLFKIRDLFTKLISELRPFHIEAEKYLTGEERTNGFSLWFDFPIEIRIYCEQYLFFFSKFLADIGIKATSSIKERAGKVLFSVSPTDDLEALDKIREALAVYLNLPSSPIIYDESFAAMRLEQQIRNLEHAQRMAETEVRLAYKVIESQDKIIAQKDSTIEQQNRIIEKLTSKSIMMDSLENKEEFEKIFEGLEVGESRWLKDNLGIKINPVKSLKSLGGKLLRKDEEIVTLDLDDKEAAK